MDSVGLMVMVGACVLLMWFSGRKNKVAREEAYNFRSSLTKGTEVMTGSGLLGTIVEIDMDTDSAVIDSEGTKSRWVLEALVKPRVVDTAQSTLERGTPGVAELGDKGDAENSTEPQEEELKKTE